MSSIIVTFKVDIGKKTPDQNTVGEGLCLIVFNPSRALEQINLIYIKSTLYYFKRLLYKSKDISEQGSGLFFCF